MRDTNAEKLLKEAWNRKLDNYDSLVKLYKDQGYTVKRNDKTGEHLVQKKDINYFGSDNPFSNIFNNIFTGGM